MLRREGETSALNRFVVWTLNYSFITALLSLNTLVLDPFVDFAFLRTNVADLVGVARRLKQHHFILYIYTS
jgi:hypothetical protein